MARWHDLQKVKVKVMKVTTCWFVLRQSKMTMTSLDGWPLSVGPEVAGESNPSSEGPPHVGHMQEQTDSPRLSSREQFREEEDKGDRKSNGQITSVSGQGRTLPQPRGLCMIVRGEDS